MSVVARGIMRRFGEAVALDGVSLDIAESEFVALLGPSGSGKTTLLRVLAGLEGTDAGTLAIGGRDMGGVPARERGIGVVFQHYALFRHMTVAQNVAFGLRVRPRAQRPSRADTARRVRELLELVQIPELAHRYPDQISGGQRQRVALARALAIEPRLLLLDEPFGALDALVRKDVRRWVRSLQERLGITTILVTHDQEEAMELADRVAVMERGRIAQFATPSELLDAPATPFVAGFIGDAARLPCEVRGGVARFEPLPLPPLRADLPDGPAQAFLRPEEVIVRPGTGAKLQLLRSSAHGEPRAVVEAGDTLLDAVLVQPIGWARRGGPCSLQIRAAHIFNASGQRARATPLGQEAALAE
jgi:sulfate transport system ATP-binding protein